jgi:Arc/MetJ-type ribon-helix-helix transcriptional regulator
VRDRVGDELFEAVGGDLVEGFAEMPVDVEGGHDRAVTEPQLQQLGVGKRIPIRYALRMAQLVTRVDEDLASLVDELIDEGVVDSRSDAVRRGLRVLIDQHQRRRTAEAIIRGYEQHPQTDDDVGWSDEATVRMIKDEPW